MPCTGHPELAQAAATTSGIFWHLNQQPPRGSSCLSPGRVCSVLLQGRQRGADQCGVFFSLHSLVFPTCPYPQPRSSTLKDTMMFQGPSRSQLGQKPL